jgi:hypothetical protein
VLGELVVVGDLVVGEVVVGESEVGELVLGEMVVGEFVVGELVVGELVVGDAVVVGDCEVGDTVPLTGQGPIGTIRACLLVCTFHPKTKINPLTIASVSALAPR